MNKLFIGLLIIAAGAGIFFFLRKNDKPTADPVNQELITGKWKMNRTVENDSLFVPYQYDFRKDSMLLRSVNDSSKADTLHYEWNKAGNLVWKQRANDSNAHVLTVVKLTADTLRVKQIADSAVLLFTRVK
jgi:hypothetical protein